MTVQSANTDSMRSTEKSKGDCKRRIERRPLRCGATGAGVARIEMIKLSRWIFFLRSFGFVILFFYLFEKILVVILFPLRARDPHQLWLCDLHQYLIATKNRLLLLK